MIPSGWIRRFLGNMKSSVWFVERRMGKNFATLLDLVKYNCPFVILPDEDYRFFMGRVASVYSSIKMLTLTVVRESELNDDVLMDVYKRADVVYFLEYGKFSKESRGFVLKSLCDLESSFSLLKIVAQELCPVHFIGSECKDELRFIADTLVIPFSYVPKDY